MTAIRASKAQYEHAFKEKIFFFLKNSVDSTKLYLIQKIKNFLTAPNESLNIH